MTLLIITLHIMTLLITTLLIMALLTIALLITHTMGDITYYCLILFINDFIYYSK